MSFGYYWLLLTSWIVYYSGGPDEAIKHRAQENSGGLNEAIIHRAPANSGGLNEAINHRAPANSSRLNEAIKHRAPAYSSGPDEAIKHRAPAADAGRGGHLGRRSWRGARSATLAAAAVCFAAGALLGWRFDDAARHREAAAAVSGAARTAALRAALEANPYWTRIRLELALQAPPPERAALLAAGLRYEPQSVPLLWALGRLSAERMDVRGAAAYMRRALDADRFDRDKQTEAVVTMARLAEELRAATRFAEARLAADAAEAFFDRYEALDRDYAANDRRFSLSAAAKAAAEQNRQLAARAEAPGD